MENQDLSGFYNNLGEEIYGEKYGETANDEKSYQRNVKPVPVFCCNTHLHAQKPIRIRTLY